MKFKTLALASLFSFAAFAEPVFITNQAVEVDKTTASKIFQGRIKSLPDGSAFTLGTLKFGSAEAEENMKALTGKSAKRIKGVWTKLQFSGKGVVPTEFGTPEELVEWVASTPGSIALVDSSKADSSVKVL